MRGGRIRRGGGIRNGEGGQPETSRGKQHVRRRETRNEEEGIRSIEGEIRHGEGGKGDFFYWERDKSATARPDQVVTGK